MFVRTLHVVISPTTSDSILAALPHRVGVPLGIPFVARSNKKLSYFTLTLSIIVGRDSSVGIATRYVLDGPGIESRWGGGFRTRPDRPWGPSTLVYNGYRVVPGGKAAEGWRQPPTPI